MPSSNTEQHQNSHANANFVEVAVGTTSGFSPTDGYEQVPVHQKVKVQLDKAAKVLNLTNTDGWVATVNKQPINPDLSYQENNLTGTIEIDWGPHEGGGGNA